MTWTDLFDRAADYNADEEAVVDALEKHRDARD